VSRGRRGEGGARKKRRRIDEAIGIYVRVMGVLKVVSEASKAK